MMSVVLDTNVLASGTVSAYNAPGRILDAWRLGQFELIVSEYIINELYQAFRKPYFRNHVSMDDTAAFVELLQNETTIIPILVKISGVATHSEDDLILATAVSAKADYLVTGDGTFLRKVGNSYQGVNLITPSKFLKILEQQS
jgi:putative PIN family toxin of toxin-antitoxin system